VGVEMMVHLAVSWLHLLAVDLQAAVTASENAALSTSSLVPFSQSTFLVQLATHKVGLLPRYNLVTRMEIGVGCANVVGTTVDNQCPAAAGEINK
jgi:hypothetical protein